MDSNHLPPPYEGGLHQQSFRSIDCSVLFASHSWAQQRTQPNRALLSLPVANRHTENGNWSSDSDLNRDLNLTRVACIQVTLPEHVWPRLQGSNLTTGLNRVMLCPACFRLLAFNNVFSVRFRWSSSVRPVRPFLGSRFFSLTRCYLPAY